MGIRKKGYFFTLDAIIATVLLTIGLLLVFTSLSHVPPEKKQYFLSDDLLNVLSAVEKNGEPYFDRIGKAKNENRMTDARTETKEIVAQLIPLQYKSAIYINNEQLYPEIPTGEVSSQVLTISRKIILDKNGEWGPYVIEAKVWR